MNGTLVIVYSVRITSDTVNLKPEFLILSIRNFRFYFLFFAGEGSRVTRCKIFHF
jgi:hypothetical protein